MHMKTSLSEKDDNWSMAGEPNEIWDGATAPPMASWQRFDLQFSCYAFAMMADVTPAWVSGCLSEWMQVSSELGGAFAL